MEKLTTLKEKSAWASNQTVLNKIGEDNGQLTFEGNPVGGKPPRPTAQKVFTKEDGILEITYTSNVVYGYLVNEDKDIPTGTEIADVELIVESINDEYFSVKEWSEVDGTPSISMTDKVLYHPSYLHIVFAVFCPMVSKIGRTIQTGQDYTVRITYYTD